MTFQFNPREVDPQTSFDALPADWYTCQAVEAKMALTAAGDAMLKLQFEVDHAAHPKYGGRRLWWNLNVGHSRDEPRAIAQRQLSALCHAIGVLDAFDDTQLDKLCGHLVELKVEVRVDDHRGPQNDVKGCRQFVSGRQRNDAKPKPRTFKADPKPQAKAAPGNGVQFTDDIPF